MTKEEKIAWLRDCQRIKSLGYGGTDKDGNFVDRRLNPEAFPIKANKLFGIPEPKTVENE